MSREPKVHRRFSRYEWWTACGLRVKSLSAIYITNKFAETTCKTCRRISKYWDDDAPEVATEGHGD